MILYSFLDPCKDRKGGNILALFARKSDRTMDIMKSSKLDGLVYIAIALVHCTCL